MHNQTPRNFLYNHRKSFYTVAWNHLTVYFLCFHVPSFCIICRIWFQNENFFLLSQWSSHQAKILPLGHIPLWVEFILYGTAKNRGDGEKPVGGRAFLSDFVYWLVISIESLCANETATCFLLKKANFKAPSECATKVVSSIPGEAAGRGGGPRQPPARIGTVACFLQFTNGLSLLDWHNGVCPLLLTDR